MPKLLKQLLWSIQLSVTLLVAAHAQTNGSSFDEADVSALMQAWPRDAPSMNCERLGAQDFGYHQVSVTRVSASEQTPAACRVRAVIADDIQFVVELPESWNGRLYVHGNGGYGGESPDGNYGAEARRTALRYGFVAGFSNLGHDRDAFPGTQWAHNSRAREIDYSYRALHATVVAARRLARAYYGKAVQYSYFDGCSTGGGQGLKAAQRYPADFDGITIGAPVFDFAGLQLYGWNNQMAIAKTPLSAQRVELLGEVILSLFDELDGIADGVIDTPERLDFIPARDLPRDPSGAKGFTEAEIEALTRIYRGPQAGGKPIYPGIPIGAEPRGQLYESGSFKPVPSESAWAGRLFDDLAGEQQTRDIVATWFKYMAFETDVPDYDWQQFDIEHDLGKLTYMSALMDATDTDLDKFRERGGRMLMYHGWGDTGVNPLMTVDYYRKVLARNGSGTRDFFRTFMVPGMFHCYGGVNVDRFDAMTPVIHWVEEGIAPSRLPASRVEDGKTTRTRPLCPYPQVARYAGAGSTDAAENFRCVEP